MFFLRAIFWLTVVYFLLPSTGEEAPAPPPREAVSAAADATATAYRVYDFCSGSPETCSAGTSLWRLADQGRRLVHDWLGGSPAPATDDPPLRRRTAPLPGDTLTVDDLQPEWHGPDPRRNG